MTGTPLMPNGALPAMRASLDSLEFIRANAPKELLDAPNWVCWVGTRKPNGKVDKAPINPATGGNAMPNVARTWGSFDAACEHALRDERIGGVGFALGDGDYWALDLDHVIDLKTGEIAPAA